MSLSMPAVTSVHIEYSATEMSDEMLASRAKSGDTDAFVELSKRHANRVFQATYRVTRNRQDAEDALQDAFLNAFTHMRNFEGRSSFSTWLTRIAINSALMILRKKRNCQEVLIDGGDGGVETSRLGSRGLLWRTLRATTSAERDINCCGEPSTGCHRSIAR